MQAPTLPRAQSSIADRAGSPTREWYAFFRALLSFYQESGSLPAEFSELEARVSVLENESGADFSISGLMSVSVQGTPQSGQVQIYLVGDTFTPGPTYYYGTDSAGNKTWAAIADAVEAEVGELTKAVDGTTGVTTFGLADVPDGGAGTLQKTAFDAKGRKTDTSAATTDDLAEGVTNLYFTDERAQDAVVRQTITNGVTDTSPSEDAVFDALALKIDNSEKAAPLGVATLDGAGKLDAGQLPSLAITETFVVASEAAMLALAAQQGDVAVRTDLNKSFILTADPASTLGNWQELLTPTSTVDSVFGRTGSVVAASGDYTFAQIGSKPTTLAGYGIVDAQPLDATLTALAGQDWAANAIPIGTGADTLSQTSFAANTFPARSSAGNIAAKPISDFGLSLVDDADAAAARGTLGIPVLDSGTYTPTLTNVTNVAASSVVSPFTWARVGGAVHVGGLLSIDPTSASTFSQLGISLPVASNFSGIGDCAGTGAIRESSATSQVRSDATNNRAEMQWTTSVDVAARTWAVTFIYTII